MRTFDTHHAERRALERLWHGLHWIVTLYALALLLHGLTSLLHAVSVCG